MQHSSQLPGIKIIHVRDALKARWIRPTYARNTLHIRLTYGSLLQTFLMRFSNARKTSGIRQEHVRRALLYASCTSGTRSTRAIKMIDRLNTSKNMSVPVACSTFLYARGALRLHADVWRRHYICAYIFKPTFFVYYQFIVRERVPPSHKHTRPLPKWGKCMHDKNAQIKICNLTIFLWQWKKLDFLCFLTFVILWFNRLYHLNTHFIIINF